MTMKKVLIFDSSSLISFTMNGLLEEFRRLWHAFEGSFLITREVKYEIIDHPLKIRRFELEALQLKALLDQKILVLPEQMGLRSETITKMTADILQQSNSMFQANGKPVHILDSGEASCLAANMLLQQQAYTSAIIVDERTTRLLGEKPENLRQWMEKKLHTPMKQMRNISQFSKFNFLRSAELAYVISKKQLTALKGPQTFEAMLYALQSHGCAIADQEIVALKKL